MNAGNLSSATLWSTAPKKNMHVFNINLANVRPTHRRIHSFPHLIKHIPPSVRKQMNAKDDYIDITKL